jgi:hypothetical protein
VSGNKPVLKAFVLDTAFNRVNSIMFCMLIQKPWVYTLDIL